MAIPQPSDQLELGIQQLEEQVGCLLEEVRVPREMVENGLSQEQGQQHILEENGLSQGQQHILERDLVYLNEEIRRKDLELNIEKEQRFNLEAELNGERQQRFWVEQELWQRDELARIHYNQVCQGIVDLMKPFQGTKSEKLIEAARDGISTAISFLLDLGADIETKDTDNRTPLHNAACRGHLSAVALLVDRGADVNAIDSSGYTPLHMAVGDGHVELCVVLLSRGAQVNHYNVEQMTPLHSAAIKGHLPVVQLLLQYGADFTLRDGFGETACFWAEIGGHTDIVACLSSWPQLQSY